MRITNTLPFSKYIHSGAGRGLFQPKHLSEDLAQRFYPWLTGDRPRRVEKNTTWNEAELCRFRFSYLLFFSFCLTALSVNLAYRYNTYNTVYHTGLLTKSDQILPFLN